SAGGFAHGESVAGAVLDVVDANAAAAPAGVADVEDAPDLSRNLRPIPAQAAVGAPAKSIVARGGKRRQRNAPLSGDRRQIDPATVPIARAVENPDFGSNGREILLQAPGAFHVVGPLQVILL